MTVPQIAKKLENSVDRRLLLGFYISLLFFLDYFSRWQVRYGIWKESYAEKRNADMGSCCCKPQPDPGGNIEEGIIDQNQAAMIYGSVSYYVNILFSAIHFI